MQHSLLVHHKHSNSPPVHSDIRKRAFNGQLGLMNWTPHECIYLEFSLLLYGRTASEQWRLVISERFQVQFPCCVWNAPDASISVLASFFHHLLHKRPLKESHFKLRVSTSVSMMIWFQVYLNRMEMKWDVSFVERLPLWWYLIYDELQ